jgi:hypothetical protein
MEYWRDAYWRLWNGCGHHVEIRMPGGELDEIVGFGGFHVEQMSANEWFIELAGVRFNVVGKKVELRPTEVRTWTEERDRVVRERI